MKITEIFFKSIRRLNVDYSNKFEKINLNNVNIFIGENGSGKSTIIDMVRSLSDLSVIPSLAKENPLSGSPPSYIIHFDCIEPKAIIMAGPMKEKHCPTEYLSCSISDAQTELFLDDLSKFNIDENNDKLQGIDFKLENEIYYRPCQIPSLEKPNSYYIQELNNIEDKLNGSYDRTLNDDGNLKKSIPVNSSNLIATKDGFIESWFEEDKSMPNKLPLQWFPSGWRAYAEITSYLLSCTKGSICLLEEPEVNLHPRLQRLLLKRIEEISIDNELQILLSTHSPTMINASSSDHVSIYHTQGKNVDKLDNKKILLDDLGYKASDIFQTNCVIWVEGPSDRIYIKHWLSNLDDKLIEGVDYSFMFYGGRILSHFDFNNNGDDMISMLKININSIVVMDSDRENENDELNDTKKRIVDCGCNENVKVWVTSGREIENYLNADILTKSIASVHHNFYKQVNTNKWSNTLKYFTKDDDNVRTADKVKVAKMYIKHCDGKSILTHELKSKITEIYDFITKARS